jgi:RIO-like serine/threonine protein kinase
MFIKNNVDLNEVSLQAVAAAAGVAPAIISYSGGSLSMEKISGHHFYDANLNQYHNKDEVVINTIKALKALHSVGVVHTDLHDQNLIVCSDNKVLIIDYGCAVRCWNKEDFENDLKMVKSLIFFSLSLWEVGEPEDDDNYFNPEWGIDVPTRSYYNNLIDKIYHSD